ncbi:MAG: VapE domain-containing protein [Planctomycetota bacterium]
MNADLIPLELKALRQWVRWRLVPERGKVPYFPSQDRYASSTDPDTWGDFATCLANVGQHGTCGIGFVFTAGDPFVGFDFDHGLPDHPIVALILEDLHTYAETSPSGTGVRGIGRGSLLGARNRADLGGGAILEMWDRERYVTVTGDRLPGSVETIEDTTDAIARIIDRYDLATTDSPEGVGGEQPPPCDASLKSRLARARRYALRMPPAVSGQNGHTTTFLTCQRIVRGFALAPADALPILEAWNATCLPPWEPADLNRKINQAAAKGRTPWGAMLATQVPVKPATLLTAEDLAAVPSDIERHKLMAAVASVEGVPITAVKADVARVRRAGPAPTASWRDLLIYRQLESGGQKLERCLTNAAVMLEHHEAWAGHVRWNELTSQAECSADAPIDAPAGPWTDRHTADATVWLQHTGLLVPSTLIPEAVLRAAHARPFHPVRDYLGGLTWDGEERLDAWLEDLAGVPRTVYSQAVGRKFMVSAVARAFRPGCKADHVLILEGPQGVGKSTLARILFDPWFGDELDIMGSKDAAMQTAAVWGLEIAELDSMRHSEISRMKAFVSRTDDRFRLPYGRFVETFPRGCVFLGSVNDAQYLRDETGARRFWPVACSAIDLEGARATRDQLWAEAVAAYRKGETWWLDEELTSHAEVEQEARFQTDSWEERIATALEPGVWKYDVPVTIGNVLHAIGVETARQSRPDQMRAAACLKRLGRVLHQRRVDGRVTRLWMPQGWRDNE